MSDEHFTHDPSVAIDLSRRKKDGPEPEPHLVRKSMYEVSRVAAPYVTMARLSLRRLVRDRVARAGALVLACLALVAVFADVLASDLPLACSWRGTTYVMPNVTHPAALAGLDIDRMRAQAGPGDWLLPPLVAHGPLETAGPEEQLLPPFAHGHPAGTDAQGRDLFARLVHGTRTALVLGLGASFILVAIGVLLGALAGLMGGTVDALLTRAVEALTAIPTLILVLVVVGTVPHPTTATLVWTIALTRWTELARLVRAEVLTSLGTEYVTAARALGAAPLRILWKHVLPNAIGPAIVAAAFGVASLVQMEAAVDFLHVGMPDTLASWGEAMGEARGHAGAWWLVVFPGLALLATLVALNLVGDAARDALDPRRPASG